jgi:hypothetical protein
MSKAILNSGIEAALADAQKNGISPANSNGMAISIETIILIQTLIQAIMRNIKPAIGITNTINEQIAIIRDSAIAAITPKINDIIRTMIINEIEYAKEIEKIKAAEIISEGIEPTTTEKKLGLIASILGGKIGAGINNGEISNGIIAKDIIDKQNIDKEIISDAIGSISSIKP